MPVEGFFADYDWFGPFGMIIITIVLTMLLIELIISTIQVIGQWKMFKKANQPGWPAIIPIYNTYTLCKITGVSAWWILITIGCTILGGIIPGVGALLGAAANIYFRVVLYVSTVRSYGKDDSWAVGLFFLKPFFFLALGIGKSEYIGPKPMQDPILEAMGIKNETTEEVVNEVSESIKYCPNCGNKVAEGTRFCTSCGKEL